MKTLAAFALVAACGGNSGTTPDSAGGSADASIDTPAGGGALGTVTAVDATCPPGRPATSTCKTLTIAGCPGIETESITATIAILAPAATPIGTIVHFAGGGGEGVQQGGLMEYRNANYRQVFVSWTTDWEQTTASGINTAACRPASVLKWIFDEPTLHAANRATGFCGEGFSGGSGQLAYALARYGMGDYLDYVNELSGPPFAHIDLGCDGNAPATATVCGDTVTMRLPAMLDNWENIQTPLTCGATSASPGEVQRWRDDSVMTPSSLYLYPHTRVEYFDCTNNATAVTGMAQLYFDQVMQAGGDTAYHCYKQADGCMNEGLGATGNQAAVDAMLAGCVPRH
jgi:hypothetical protein